MILVVEPDAQLASSISSMLKSQGFDSIIAHDSQRAIGIADDHKIDLVIIELIMRRHNGLEFIYEFRSYSDWWNTPIIAYSHLSSEELGLDDRLNEDVGIVEHLYKPATSLSRLGISVKKHHPQYEAV